jgi:hypothetical protein
LRTNSRAIAALAVTSLVATLAVGANGVAAQADPPSPSVITVPTGDRSYARNTEVYGDTDYGVVLREEVNPADYNGFEQQGILLAPNGSESTIVGPTGGDLQVTVFGDRVIDAGSSTSGPSAERRKRTRD